jgi:hypothetical protein
MIWHVLSQRRNLFVDFNSKLAIIGTEEQGGIIEKSSDLSPPFGRDGR